MGWKPLDGDRFVELWDVVGQRRGVSLGVKAPAPSALAWSPDGKTLAIGREDGSIGLWDPVSGAEAAAFQVGTRPVSRLAFGPDGARLFVATFGSRRQPNVAVIGAKEKKILAEATADPGGVSSMALTPKA